MTAATQAMMTAHMNADQPTSAALGHPRLNIKARNSEATTAPTTVVTLSAMVLRNDAPIREISGVVGEWGFSMSGPGKRAEASALAGPFLHHGRARLKHG
jgi:hypothetical protein